MVASDCLRPSHVLEITESRLSFDDGVLAAPMSLSAVIVTVMKLELRREVGDLLLFVSRDVVKPWFTGGAACLPGLFVLLGPALLFFFGLFLFLFLFLPMMSMRRCSIIMQSRICSCYAVKQESWC
jgi:hypothetical protein